MKLRVTLIADIGKMLTNGETVTHMVCLYDTMDISEWSEIDAPTEEDPEDEETTEEVGDTE